jgi:hypothetical protein
MEGILDASEASLVLSNHEATLHRPALLLSRRDISALMSLEDYLSAVEAGFRACRNGDAEMPIHIRTAHGGFHAKSARLVLDRPYVAVKCNGNIPGNPQRNGLGVSFAWGFKFEFGECSRVPAAAPSGSAAAATSSRFLLALLELDPDDGP